MARSAALRKGNMFDPLGPSGPSNWLDSMWRLHLWGLVKRCRIITGSLQKKLSEGSWEAKDKPKLQGSS